MSILIKGMEMPKRCFDCPVYDVSAVFCKALDKWVDDGEIETERHKDCPLIEQKTGKWDVISKEGNIYQCSNCGNISRLGNYCPNCGAKMAIIEAEEDE